MLFNQAIDIPEALTSNSVSVTLKGEQARYNLRFKESDVAAIKKANGLKLPSRIGASSVNKDIRCVKLGPDEWIVFADAGLKSHLDKTLAKISKDYVCSVTDISHRNVAFDITGAGAAKLVNVGCPLDLSLEAFPVGKVTRTIFESSQIMLLRTGEESFHVETWRSFGPYLRDYFLRVLTTR